MTEFDGVTPDMQRAAEKRAAAIAAGRPADEPAEVAEAAEPVKAKARRQTTRG